MNGYPNKCLLGVIVVKNYSSSSTIGELKLKKIVKAEATIFEKKSLIYCSEY